MFGRSKPVVLQSYGRRRSRWRLPPWLMLLLLGTAAGAGGVLFVQERYLPPRLSASESVELRRAFETADAERQSLSARLAEATTQLESARAEQQRLTQSLGESRQTITQLRSDVSSIVEQLPPDPRGGPIGVRAARLSVQGGALSYSMVLSRERAGSEPFSGVLQFVLTGQSARGNSSSVGLKPVPVSIGRHESLSGTVPLPEGFTPRQATINLLDQPDGRVYGRRVVYVR